MSLIAKAKKLTVSDRDAELARVREALTAVKAKLSRGKRLRKDLLGIERLSVQSLDAQIEGLKAERDSLIEQLRFLDPPKYQSLSTEPLTWRDEQGFPKLAIFGLDSSTFRIKAHGWNEQISMEPQLPPGLARLYADVCVTLRKGLSRERERVLGCEFIGIIPDDARRRLENARPFFKHIFIIAEPGKGFTLEETVRVIPKEDPLIVGSDGHSLWLIADFDTTPVEEALIFHESSEPKV